MYRSEGDLLSRAIVLMVCLAVIIPFNISQKAADNNARTVSATITSLGEKGMTVEYLDDYGQTQAQIDADDITEYQVGDEVSIKIRNFKFLCITETTMTLAEPTAGISERETVESDGRESDGAKKT